MGKFHMPTTKSLEGIPRILKLYMDGDMSYSRALMELQLFMDHVQARETIRKAVEED